MGVRALLAEQLCHPHRAQKVDLDGRVQGRLEADGGGRVHHDVRGGEQAPVLFVEPQAVDGNVTADDAHPALHLGVEVPAQLLTEAVEAVVAEDLAPGSLGGRCTPPGPNQQHNLAVRHRPKEALDQRRAEKACGARYRHALARKRLRYHTLLLARRSASAPG